MPCSNGLLNNLLSCGTILLGGTTHIRLALYRRIHAVGAGTHLRQNRKHCSHGGLVVVGARGAGGEALHNVRDRNKQQGHARNEANNPNQHTQHRWQEAHYLHKRCQARHQHAGEGVLLQRNLIARKRVAKKEVLARRIVVGNDNDGTRALGHLVAGSLVNAHHVLAALHEVLEYVISQVIHGKQHHRRYGQQ